MPYIIKNALSGKVLDVTGGSFENKAKVQQWSFTGGMNQQWDLRPVGYEPTSDYYIVSVQSGKLLDVTDQSPHNGSQIQQWSFTGGYDQIWHISGSTILSRSNDKALDIPGDAIFADGTILQQWDSNGGQNQQWVREEIN